MNIQAFVMAKDGSLYMATHEGIYDHDNPNLSHASLLEGKPAEMAGMIGIHVNGKIGYLSNDSGHYQPEALDMYRGIKKLQKLMPGVLANDCTIMCYEINSNNPILVDKFTEIMETIQISQYKTINQFLDISNKKTVNIEPMSIDESSDSFNKNNSVEPMEISENSAMVVKTEPMSIDDTLPHKNKVTSNKDNRQTLYQKLREQRKEKIQKYYRNLLENASIKSRYIKNIRNRKALLDFTR